jgi:hypothetical protein
MPTPFAWIPKTVEVIDVTVENKFDVVDTKEALLT